MLLKRMFEINPDERFSLMKHKTPDIHIREARNGERNVYVIETDDKHAIKACERIVELYAID